MINSDCSNSLQASTHNNLHKASTSELTSNEPSVNDQNRIANFNGFNIIEFPPEIHMEMCKYLDSQSMKELRRTCKRFRDNVSIVVVRNKEIKEIKESLERELREAIGEAIDTGSETSCERIQTSLEKGVTLPTNELTQFLRGALMMESSVGVDIANAMWLMGATLPPPEELTQFLKGAMSMDRTDGINIARALRRMGATLPLEDLPQALRGALRLNRGPALQWHVETLLEMGATLPHEELADELRGALRTNSRIAFVRATVITNMGVTLPPVELPEFMLLALAMPGPVGVFHAMLVTRMMGV